MALWVSDDFYIIIQCLNLSFIFFVYSKRAARNKMYSTVSMTPGDEHIDFNDNEGDY